MNALFEFFQHASTVIAPWVASLVGIAAATLVANWAAQAALRQLARASAKSRTQWDDTLVHAAHRPTRVLVAVVGLGLMARVLQAQATLPFLEQVLSARDIALIACVAWFLLRFIGRFSSAILETQRESGEPVDPSSVDAVAKLARIVVVAVAGVTAAQTLGFEIAGLLALGGVGGLAIGLAAKDILANLFGGLTIYLDRPFRPGEWIRSPDKKLEGTVEHIGWRQTRIRTFDMNPIYVPNAVFTSIIVENPSRRSHRRIVETVGLRYEDLPKVPAIVNDLGAMLRAHAGVEPTTPPIVYLTHLSASSVDLSVYAFTNTIDWTEYLAIKQDVLLEVARIVADHGAEIAYPTQTLHHV